MTNEAKRHFENPPYQPRLEAAADGSILLWIKAVPNASRTQIAGMLGDRLKLRIAAPPEAGKANQAVCRLLASALDLKSAQIQIHSGHASPEKVVRISGITAAEVQKRLNG